MGSGLLRVIGADLGRYTRGRNKGKSLGKAPMLIYRHLDPTTPKSLAMLRNETRSGDSTVDRAVKKLAAQGLATKYYSRSLKIVV